MKRFLSSFLVFLGCAGCTYIIVLVLVASYAPNSWRSNLNYKLAGNGFLYSRLKEADTIRNIDVLILGTSHAYRGYDTRLFAKQGWRAFNLGSSAQSFVQTDYLLNKYISRLDPKFVIFDIYPIATKGSGIESMLDLIANSNIDYDLFLMALRTGDAKVYNTFIYAALRQLFKLDKAYKEPFKKGEDQYIKGGYVQNYSVYRSNARPIKREYTVTDDQLKAFDHIIKLLRSKKLPYVLVQAPITRKKYKYITNNNQMDKLFGRYGKYYNFNELMSISEANFSDDSHLNQHGVEVYDQKIIDVLKKNNIETLLK